MATSRGSTGQSAGSAEALDGAALLGLELQQIQAAEGLLSQLLPSLADAAESDSLRECIELREEQGKRLIGEIEASFQELDEAPPKKKNLAAEGLLEAAQEHVREMDEGPALDAALVADIQKVEHYCIAAWGTARSLAQATGRKATAHAMEKALQEGKSLDEKLTELAEKEITPALLSEELAEDDEGSRSSRKGSTSAKQSPRH